jgi:hypothetical protein
MRSDVAIASDSFQVALEDGFAVCGLIKDDVEVRNLNGASA